MTVVIDQESLRRARLRTLFHGIVLFGALIGILAGCVWLIAGDAAVLGLLAVLGAGLAAVLRLSPHLVMRFHRGVAVEPGRVLGLDRALGALAMRAGLPAVPALYWLPGGGINALAAGGRRAAAIGVSDGAFRLLSRREMTAVLAHEVAHIAAGDTRLMALGDMIARTTRDVAVFGLAACLLLLLATADPDQVPLALVLLLALATPAAAALQMALSRNREFAADLMAVRLTGDPLGLVEALEKIERLSAGPWSWLFRRRAGGEPSRLLRTHPDSAARVARLLEQVRLVPAPLPVAPVGWRLPLGR